MRLESAQSAREEGMSRRVEELDGECMRLRRQLVSGRFPMWGHTRACSLCWLEQCMCDGCMMHDVSKYRLMRGPWELGA